MAATAAMTPMAGLQAGIHGGISAALGGLVGFSAGLAFAFVVSLHKGESAGGTLLAALRAEAIKIAVSVFLLLLVLTAYKDVVAIWFIGTCVVSLLIFAMAFFVRDT